VLLIGLDSLLPLLPDKSFSAKMVFNQHGAIFFPVARQHREMKAAGISYEDDYKGNALAAMLSPGKIEIRYHKAFPDREVARIIGLLRQERAASFLADWHPTYQGRPLNLPPS
jgi:hypothetical protein